MFRTFRASVDRRARPHWIAAVALVMMLFGGIASTAVAQTRPEFYGIIPGGAANPIDLAAMQNSKVRTARFFLSWASVERQRGVFQWSGTDSTVRELAMHGIRAEPQLTGTPSWATGSSNERTPPLQGEAKQGWKQFVTLAVHRYEPGGTFWQQNPSVPAKPVTDWQVWNEPNLKKEWPPNANAKTYGSLVKITDTVIQRTDPNARVLLAGLSGSTHGNKAVKFSRFLSKLYHVRGIKRHFDAVAFHPYGPTIKDTKTRIQQVRNVMKRRHDEKTSLWITEMGYGSGPKDKFGLNKGSPQAQAASMNKTFKLILGNRRKWKIGKLDWYDWRDPANPSDRAYCSFCPYAGLFNANYTPKPAYWVFRKYTTPAPSTAPRATSSLSQTAVP